MLTVGVKLKLELRLRLVRKEVKCGGSVGMCGGFIRFVRVTGERER